MRQYHSLKQQKPDHLLLFRLGDFYELFYEDAVVASRDLEITLTSRNKEKGEAIPMCGVPAHSVDGYINKLIVKGHRLAIADQVEEAQQGKQLVRREITRIITPGTTSDPKLLEAGQNNYLAAVAAKGDRAGLAYVDISTGEFRMTEIEASAVDAALAEMGATEVLQASAGPLFAEDSLGSQSGANYMRTEIESWVFDVDYSQRTLSSHFKLHSLDGLGAAGHPAAVAAAGAILHYLRDTQRAALQHIEPPNYYTQHNWMVLDTVTVRHLELVEPLFGGEAASTLLRIIDKTQTAMGKRLLRNWLLRPSISREEIESRLDGVEELTKETIRAAEIRQQLTKILDIERLLAKVTLGSANPRDLVGLGSSFQSLPVLRSLISELLSSRMLQLHEHFDELADLCDAILLTLADEPPFKLSEGGVIREGIDAELDELRGIRQNSRAYIAQIETRERERTGIHSLKVRFNNVFGFYIEVSKANLAAVPADYDRKQTLVNAERFITPELKEYETKVLQAEEKILEREKARFEEVRAAVAAEAQRIRSSAATVAELDVLRGMAQIATECDYVRPVFNSGGRARRCGPATFTWVAFLRPVLLGPVSGSIFY